MLPGALARLVVMTAPHPRAESAEPEIAGDPQPDTKPCVSPAIVAPPTSSGNWADMAIGALLQNYFRGTRRPAGFPDGSKGA
jgi:hypothetical protein